MGKALQITRTDHTGAALRAFASKCRDGAQVRRLLALAMVLDGHPRSLAASSNGMDRQTLSDWVHRYNDDGVDGLKTRLPPGRLPFLTEPQMAELNELVVNGPDSAINGVVRWRCADLLGEVKRRFSIEVHESTIGKWLHKLGLTRLQPRPVHPKKDPEAETAFKKHFVSLVKEALIGTTAATPIEIWFQDEARVGQKGTHAYIWAPVGSRPLMVRDNRHDSAYIFGAICPARGVGAAMIMPAANTEGMNEHLKEISTQIAPSSIAVVICDRAGWHQSSKELVVPDNIRLLPLPAYSPELNPMENVWDYLRQNKLCALVWDTAVSQVITRCSGKARLPRQRKGITQGPRSRTTDGRLRNGRVPPGWQEGPDGLDGICNDRDRAMSAGLVAFHRHADFARWAIGAAGSRFVEAGEAAPELDYRLRHHQAAALHAFHRLVSFCPLHEAIPRRWSNTTRTKAASHQWRCRVWRRRHTKSHDVGAFIANACSPGFRTQKRSRSPHSRAGAESEIILYIA